MGKTWKNPAFFMRVSKKGPFLKTTTLDIKGLSGHLFWWITGTPQSKRLPQVGSKLSKAIATIDT